MKLPKLSIHTAVHNSPKPGVFVKRNNLKTDVDIANQHGPAGRMNGQESGVVNIGNRPTGNYAVDLGAPTPSQRKVERSNSLTAPRVLGDEQNVAIGVPRHHSDFFGEGERGLIVERTETGRSGRRCWLHDRVDPLDRTARSSGAAEEIQHTLSLAATGTGFQSIKRPNIQGIRGSILRIGRIGHNLVDPANREDKGLNLRISHRRSPSRGGNTPTPAKGPEWGCNTCCYRRGLSSVPSS